VILNGVDVEHFRPAAGEARHNARKSYLGGFDGCVVAYAGSLISRKAVDDLLRAAGQLKQTGMNIRYLLIGDGKERQNLAKLARTFGLEREVIFVGHVNDVRAPLAAADVFVLPSLSEGLSCALLEGMALGLPPVVTDVSGTRDVITDESCGLVVPTRNPRAIAQALGRLLQNSDLGFKMGCSARARVLDKFSATRMAWEYHQLFQELLSPQQPRVETKVGFVDP
jgi:glycosyltransferase involved in cell wall biosynthesis